MSADHMQMHIDSTAIWHVAANTIELNLQSMEPPPRPEWITEDQWYGGGGDRITVTLPAKKTSVSAPTGWTRTGTDPVSGAGRYTLYTWNGTAWANPRPCDGSGNLL